MTTTLRETIQQRLADLVQSQQEEHIAVDVLRAVHQQANLLFETEQVKDLLCQDPFEHLDQLASQLPRICQCLQVIDCHRITNRLGYAYIQACVKFVADKSMNQQGVESHVQLSFCYERQVTDNGSMVTYSIDQSRDYGPSERLLWIQVFGMKSTPSTQKAQNLADDEDDDWEDVDDDDSVMEEETMDLKRARCDKDDGPTIIDLQASSTNSKDNNDKSNNDACDKFVTYMDPDALARLLQWLRLDCDEITAFFFLVTFPFYEHEWDLVGFCLDGVFGADEENDDYSNDEPHGR